MEGGREGGMKWDATSQEVSERHHARFNFKHHCCNEKNDGWVFFFYPVLHMFTLLRCSF